MRKEEIKFIHTEDSHKHILVSRASTANPIGRRLIWLQKEVWGRKYMHFRSCTHQMLVREWDKLTQHGMRALFQSFTWKCMHLFVRHGVRNEYVDPETHERTDDTHAYIHWCMYTKLRDVHTYIHTNIHTYIHTYLIDLQVCMTLLWKRHDPGSLWLSNRPIKHTLACLPDVRCWAVHASVRVWDSEEGST